MSDSEVMDEDRAMKTWLHMPSPGASCAIVGEVAQAHDGSLGFAHAYIDAIAAAGATAVKFQTHIAAAESTRAEPWRKKFSLQDESRYDYWRRMEFTPEQWMGLKVHAEAKGLLFLSSPFSLEAVELLQRIGVAAWKIASGEVANPAFLEAIRATRQPIMLSTGMSGMAEIKEAVAKLRSPDVPLAVLQCSSMYPCPVEAVGLNMIDVFRTEFGCAVGLSDHSGTIFPSLAAATIGVEVLEVHVTLSREMFGPDVCASVTTAELRTIVDGVRYIERMRRSPVDKNQVPASIESIRGIFMKSVVARTDLAAGTVLSLANLAVKKPGGGLPAARLPELSGRRLRHAVRGDQPISIHDLD